DLGAQILACLDDRTPTPINNLALFSRNSDPRKKRPRKNPVPQRSHRIFKRHKQLGKKFNCLVSICIDN
ncbi:MAG: hypothetical protein KJ621_02370, partial [Proteobacteria bacterium]|nr:hypothetical protein [Pseudomonadota bacterium]